MKILAVIVSAAVIAYAVTALVKGTAERKRASTSWWRRASEAT